MNPETKRASMIYYHYLDLIVRGVAADCKSLIDVGSGTSGGRLIESFDWIEELVSLDIKNVYTSARVRGIKADFFDYTPEKRFDFAMCCEVLEHIPDAGPFAKRLFDIADKVLISVPYLWPKGACKHHVNDPVNLEKLEQWTGRTPAHHIVIKEPFSRSRKGSRLIAYYPAAGDTFSVKTAARTMREGFSPLKRKAANAPPAQDRTMEPA